jgi:ribonuclease BN (tRNA processing enzyme)
VELSILGCSGTIPAADDGCSAYLLRHDGFTLLLEVGTGAVSSLLRLGGPRGKVLPQIDAVFVSHLHADHWLDLVPLSYVRHYQPTGPGSVIDVHAPEPALGQLIAAGGWPREGEHALHPDWNFVATAPGRREIGPFVVDLVRAEHPEPCHASRWTAGGKSLVFSGDTGESEDVVKLADGADVALFEASWYADDDPPPGVHLTAAQAADHANRAGVGRLLLTHVTPWGDLERTEAEAVPVAEMPCEAVVSGRSYGI